MTRSPRSNARLVIVLCAMVGGMFGFGYALVPLYDVLCEITGIGGKTGTVAAAEARAQAVDTSRWITVEFTGNTAAGLPWEFRPAVKKLRVRPGEIAEAQFFARNISGMRTVGQAVPSVTPGRAARYFKKTECFCFSHQSLEADETRQMPVRFMVEADLPEDIRTITLSYAFYNSAKYAAKAAGGDA